MIKKASTDHPVNEVIENRWSPYRFLPDRLIPRGDLLSLLEAARWAPSSYNEQPWRFIIAPKEETEEFEKLLTCLVKANQDWAKNSSVLMLGITHLTFDRNGKENKAAMHDLGAAVSYLSFEATIRGISVHQMIGIDPKKAKKIYAIPEDHEVLIAFALGYPDLIKVASDPLSIRDKTPRVRKTISEIVFYKEWGSSYI